MNRDLRLVNVSDLWLLATGLDRDAVIGMHLHQLGLPTRVRDALEPLAARVIETREAARIETLIPTAVGLRWAEFEFVAERDCVGEITHVIGMSSSYSAPGPVTDRSWPQPSSRRSTPPW